jgi:pyruvate-formate lyase-activating enzyme
LLFLIMLLQVLFCIKHLDPMQYEHITGLHQSGSLAFAAELKERRIPFWLRYVLIPNLTDRVGDIEMLIAFAKAQPTMLVSVRAAVAGVVSFTYLLCKVHSKCMCAGE